MPKHVQSELRRAIADRAVARRRHRAAAAAVLCCGVLAGTVLAAGQAVGAPARPLLVRPAAGARFVTSTRSSTFPRVARHHALTAAAITASQFPETGGHFVVRVTAIPVGSRCVFSAGAGITSYDGTFRCSGLFLHAGRLLPNRASVTRRWTVRALVVSGSATRSFAWVVSVAGQLVPATTTTSSTTTTTTSTSTTTSTTSTAPGIGGVSNGTPRYESYNWAGYVLATQQGGVTEVGATWTVPSLDCSGSPTNASDADWVGVDGATTNSLFQTGVDSSCTNGQQTSTAWWEELPATAQGVFTVSPGDSITASVSEVSSGVWQYSITDDSTNQTSSASMPYSGVMSSADWIEEDPTLVFGNSSQQAPFADFGNVTFSSLTMNGSPPGLDLSMDGMELVSQQGDTPLAVPSQASGGAFTVSYQ